VNNYVSWLTEINWQTIANVATAAALLIAAGAFIWQIISHGKEKAYTKSHFAFQSAVESYDQAIEMNLSKRKWNRYASEFPWLVRLSFS